MAITIFKNLGLNSLRMQDSTTGNFATYTLEELGSGKSALSKIKNFVKNLFLAAVAIGQVIMTALSFIEILSLLTVYFLPLMALAVVTLISESFRNFVTRAFNRIKDTTSNNIRLASLLFGIPIILLGFRSIFGIGRAAPMLLKRIAEMDAIETIIAISLALASSIASVYSRSVNRFLAIFGLVKETPEDVSEIQRGANEGHNAAWRFGGVIFSIVAAARFLPNLLYGIAGPSIVVGLGLAAAESIADSVENTHEHTGDQGYGDTGAGVYNDADRTTIKGASAPPLDSIHQDGVFGNSNEQIPTAVPVAATYVEPTVQQQPRETRWMPYTPPQQRVEHHHHHYDRPGYGGYGSGLLDGLFAGWGSQPRVNQTQNVYVNAAPTTTYSRAGSSSRADWRNAAFIGSSSRPSQQPSTSVRPPVAPTQPSTSGNSHPLQQQRAIGFTSFFS